MLLLHDPVVCTLKGWAGRGPQRETREKNKEEGQRFFKYSPKPGKFTI